MTDQNRNLTTDDYAVINAVCRGMTTDFTINFLTRIDEAREVFNRTGWISEIVPEVKTGDYRGFNAVVMGEDGKNHVVGGMYYLNRFLLHIEDYEEHIKQGCDIDVHADAWDDVTTLYTGWAIRAYDTSEGTHSFDFVHAERVIAWRELPDFTGDVERGL